MAVHLKKPEDSTLPEATPLHGDPLGWLTAQEVQAVLHKSASTLRAWRKAKVGPPWRRAGGRTVLYQRGALIKWLQSQEGGGEVI